MVKRIALTAMVSFWLGVTLTGLWVGCGHTQHIPKMVELASGECVVIARLHTDTGVDMTQTEAVCATVEELAPLVEMIVRKRALDGLRESDHTITHTPTQQ